MVIRDANFFLLRDLESNEIDAILCSTKTTKEEIDDIISKMKENNKLDCGYEDIIKSLPSDVKIVAGWNKCHNKDLNIYY